MKQPNKDDWGKLRQVLKYLKGSKRLKLSLSAKILSILKWWINASHTVHENCRSHTGMGMTFGKRMLLMASKKQKINGKSSTESKLVAMDDMLPQVLWTGYFLEAQGYKIEKNNVYQDNKSAILLEMNGKGSSSKSKCTKHIKVQYFFVLPRRMLIELIYHCVFWLNAFPAKSGVSEHFSPREIVIRQKVDYAKHCKVRFRVYCKVYNEPTPSNNFHQERITQSAWGQQGISKQRTNSFA